jgi:hypothetical protein
MLWKDWKGSNNYFVKRVMSNVTHCWSS